MLRGIARQSGITLRQIGLQKRNYQEVISIPVFIFMFGVCCGNQLCRDGFDLPCHSLARRRKTQASGFSMTQNKTTLKIVDGLAFNVEVM